MYAASETVRELKQVAAVSLEKVYNSAATVEGTGIAAKDPERMSIIFLKDAFLERLGEESSPVWV